MTHENDFPPLFDDTPPDTDNESRAVYARPAQKPQEPEEAPEPQDEEPLPPAPIHNDIDSALAALASLQDLAFQEEAYSDEEYAPLEDVPDSDEAMAFVAPTASTGEWGRIDVPTATIISEYVDVAKAFYDKRESGFVNGLLDAIAKDVRR